MWDTLRGIIIQGGGENSTDRIFPSPPWGARRRHQISNPPSNSTDRAGNILKTHIFDPPTQEKHSPTFLKITIFDPLDTHFHHFPFFENLSPRPLTYPVLFPRLPPSFHFFIPAPAGNRTGHLPAPHPYSSFFLYEENIYSA